jgi:hypothetical protein
LYNEKSGLLDGEATQKPIWRPTRIRFKNAITRTCSKVHSDLSPVAFSTREHTPREDSDGVLVYMKTAEDNDALVWVDKDGNSVTESQLAVLEAAACKPDTPALPRRKIITSWCEGR